LSTNRASIWDDGNTIFSGTNEEDLGKAVVAALQHPAETANKFVYVSSLAASQNEILAALEKATSTKWEVTRASTKQRLDVAKEALSKGDFSGAFTIVKATVLGNIPGLNQHFEAEEEDRLLNDVLFIPRASVEETVRRILASGQYNGNDF
jgi:nucleoside-diphosphate-sugar epimerase